MLLTEEQLAEIAKKEDYISEKNKLITQRKALLEELSFAENDMEEGLIVEQRDVLAVKIKTLASRLREIEAWESLA